MTSQFKDIQDVYHPYTGEVIGQVGSSGYWSFFSKAGDSEPFLHGPYITQGDACQHLISRTLREAAAAEESR